MFEQSDIHKIIERIANDKVVESIVYKINRNEDPANLKDLIQDIYFQLLTKNNEKVIKIYNSGDIKFYITRIVMNNILSNTSPYHRVYRKHTGDTFDSLSLTEFNNISYDDKWTT